MSSIGISVSSPVSSLLMPRRLARDAQQDAAEALAAGQRNVRVRPSSRDRRSARNPSAAPAAGRFPVKTVQADRRCRPDRRHRAPARARARRARSRSTDMVPSGRSAMICTVWPAEPETRTRTSRKPRLSSTGAASAATRAEIPVSVTSRGSLSCCSLAASVMLNGPTASAILPSLQRVKIPARFQACRLRRAPVIKKSGSRAGPTLIRTDRTIRPL